MTYFIKLLNCDKYLKVTKDQLNAILNSDLITARTLGITDDQYMSCKSEKWPTNPF